MIIEAISVARTGVILSYRLKNAIVETMNHPTTAITRTTGEVENASMPVFFTPKSSARTRDDVAKMCQSLGHTLRRG